MSKSPDKLNIRYLGFESAPGGGRRLEFSVTSPGVVSRVTLEIPSSSFSGSDRISFQESTAVCYEKLRDLIDREQAVQDAMHLLVTQHDIEQFRPRRRRAVAARAKN
jgi:hypothetical protein